MTNAKEALAGLLAHADIELNGSRPWDVKVHNEDLYKRALQQGTLGVGEAYMDGWWDCDQMDEMFYRAISAHLDHRFTDAGMAAYALKLYQTLFNLQNKNRAFEVGEKHYDFGNDMFAWMLGPTMNYSCGYWKNAATLDEAQTAKMDLICRKLQLSPGMKVLDIGCGWGALCKYMADNYGVDATGISVSKEQIEYAKNENPGIKWIMDDYRALDGEYDRVFSVGMFEHVGYKNYDEFMQKVHQLLKPDGLFLLHTIGANYQRKGTDPWINKYIFPNGMVPSEDNVTKAFADLFVMEDWHNFGADYDKTLMAWAERFEDGCDRDKFKHTEKMRRMFRYYLLSCAGAFRARDLQLWQIVLSPHGVPGGYRSVR